ncbi:MAG: hypothetical protein R2844_12445 [Caldilineales bacterium]
MNPTNRHKKAAGWLLRVIGTVVTVAILLIVLAACGRQTPTPAPAPSPTATKTPTADATSTATATASAAAQPSPTPSPTATLPPAATATPTETPEPTPTPSATPFPPGPASKLGVFVGYNYGGQLFDLLATGNVAVVKTLEYDPNFVAEMKQISPDTLIVSRYTPLPLPDLDNWDPLAAARQFVDLLLPIATEPSRLANIDCWEAYNEPTVTTTEQMASLAVFEANGPAAGRGGHPILCWQLRHRPAAPGAVAGFLPCFAGGPTIRRLPGAARVLRARDVVCSRREPTGGGRRRGG